MARQTLARIAALFYLGNFVLGTMALMRVRAGDPGGAAQLTLLAALDYAVVAALLGRLFEPAGRGWSWAVAAVGLAGCALSAAQSVHLIGPEPNPLAIFGVYCLGVGALVVRTAMMPRWIGALLMLGGLSWLTFAVPQLSERLQPFNMAPGAIAELIFTLWLLVFGLRQARGTTARFAPRAPTEPARSSPS
jgi:hypothetical protein